jgi:hypothetical protein
MERDVREFSQLNLTEAEVVKGILTLRLHIEGI